MLRVIFTMKNTAKKLINSLLLLASVSNFLFGSDLNPIDLAKQKQSRM